MRITVALLTALSFILTCAGCWGTPIQPVYNYEKCPFESDSVKTLSVFATNPWQETGILTDVGDELFFSAEGEWSMSDEKRKNSPAGRTGLDSIRIPIIPDVPWAALIGRIGDATPFLIGVQTYKRADSQGNLYLAMNDCLNCNYDNWGSIEVTIHHRKVSGQAQPPPPVAPAVPPTGVSLRAASKTRVVAAGISTYSDSGIPKVDYGAGDAQAFAAFAQQAGVPAENITTLVGAEATRSKIIEAVDKLRMATMDKSETAVFYFSGHGAPLVKEGKIYSSVIVPYDASEQSLQETGIELDWIKDRLGDLPGSSIVILDACFSGKEGRSVMASNLRGIAVVSTMSTITASPPANTWWLTATSGDNFANDLPKESHGLFTYYLLKALRGEQGVDADENGLITVKEAFTWTKEKVTSISAKSLGRLQVPELSGGRDMVLVIPK